MKQLKTFTILLFLLSYGTTTTLAQTSAKDEFGFSIGLQTGGEAYIAEFDEFVALESGLSLLGFYDFFITDKFAIGANANVAFPSLELSDESVTFYELALALKVKFSLSDKVSYKPGANFGYRLITAEDIDTIEGLGLNLTNEFQFHISETITPFVDVGFISQAAGGNDEFNATFSPIIVIRVGIVFN
ncbi:MAG: hypothetical protein AAFX55_04935 [Bacteroidota bacterium]